MRQRELVEAEEEGNEDDCCDGVIYSVQRNVGKKAASWLEFYEVPRVVMIRAPPLQIPRMIAKGAATLCFLVWLVWSQQYLEEHDITSSRIGFDISFPQCGNRHCRDNDWDCDDMCPSHGLHDGVAADHGHCSPQKLNELRDEIQRYYFTDTATHNYSRARWPEKPRVLTSCPRLDTHDIFRSIDIGRPLVTTAVTSNLQRRCLQTEACIWKNLDFNVSLVHLSDFVVGASPEIWEEGKPVDQASLTGFVSMPDGTRCVIPCNSSTPHGAHCRQSLPNWDQYPTCKGCFRNWGVDYMPLRTLLAAANVSLDEKTGNTSLPRRFWGSLLRVNVHYSNQKDLWTSLPPALRMSYTYTITLHRDEEWQIEIHHSFDQQERRLMRHAGLRFEFTFDGTLADLNAIYLLQTLGGISVFWYVFMIIVDYLILWIYEYSPGHEWQHLPRMLEHFSEKQTPHHRLVKEGSWQDLKQQQTQLRESSYRKVQRRRAASSESEQSESASDESKGF